MATKKEEIIQYPRELDEKGCIFGRHLEERVDEMKKDYERIRSGLAKLTLALVGVALSFSVSGCLLAVNLVLGLLPTP